MSVLKQTNRLARNKFDLQLTYNARSVKPTITITENKMIQNNFFHSGVSCLSVGKNISSLVDMIFSSLNNSNAHLTGPNLRVKELLSQISACMG
jgi:hypothetical protein